METQLMTVGQTAKTLSISNRTLWTLTQSGEITAVRIGKRVLYSPDDIRTFIDRSKCGGQQ